MPQDLEIESGSCEIGYEMMYGDVQKVLGYRLVQEAGITTREELIAYLEKEHPEYLKRARQYKSNLERHGHKTWYGWRLENWGTKWDVTPSDIEELDNGPGHLSLVFYTAWSPADGIYSALCNLCEQNELDIQISWFYDEPGMLVAGYLS